ncbi:MAG: helix-turn-helix domain-containing protein [Actinomycetota bacterium]
MEGISKAVGAALRQARLERGLSLTEVKRRSHDRFKPSALGGYERGERSISLERFCQLARLYGVRADRLLSKILGRLTPEGSEGIVVDLNQLALIHEREGRVIAEFIHKVKAEREDYLSDVITLRSGDLEELALKVQLEPRVLLARLRPALRSSPLNMHSPGY